MELKDIKNKSTLGQVQRLNIDISKFSDYKDLTRHIRLINVKENQKRYLTEKPDYYKNYMKNKYRQKAIEKKGFVRSYVRKNKNDIDSIKIQIQKLQEQLQSLSIKQENPTGPTGISF